MFEAWTKPELFQRWWVPKSLGLSLLSCEVDARVGGKYRLVFRHGASEPMAFFGTYIEVTPHSRLVWTNEEGGDAGQVSTVTFEGAGAGGCSEPSGGPAPAGSGGQHACGTISVGEHFDAWESVGLDMGRFYEVSFVVEGYLSTGSACPPPRARQRGVRGSLRPHGPLEPDAQRLAPAYGGRTPAYTAFIGGLE